MTSMPPPEDVLLLPLQDEPPDPLFDIELKLLLEAVYLRYQHDFRDYALNSLRRRVRQVQQAFGAASLAQLQERLLREPALFAQALPYFTVQVSELFRDPGYYLALRQHVVPLLHTYPSLKCWVAGCSTGEEAWSLAILLHEEGLLDRTLIYATDIHAEALRAAEAGIYPLERLARASRQYLAAGGRGSLSDYYRASDQAVLMDRQLKEHLVFADHSLATDSVFSEVHLVSCRNVLIYFNRKLQDRAVGLFREALVHRGFLGLGTQETLQFGAHAEAFDVVDGPHKLYRRL
jgi:chemotaxis protein methyltransferase CheR